LTGPLLQRLAGRFRLTCYDERGCGLSDWNVPEIPFLTFLNDLEQVACLFLLIISLTDHRLAFFLHCSRLQLMCNLSSFRPDDLALQRFLRA